MWNKIKTFFDDPVSNFVFWYRQMTQRQMRKAIDLKYEKNISNQVYWIPTTKEENLGLSDDKVEQISQRMILSQIGYLISQRLWAKRTFIIFPILFILNMLFCYWIFVSSHTTSNEYFLSLVTSICFFIGICLILGGYVFAPFTAQFIFPNRAVKAKEIKTVENTIKQCLVRDLPEDTPIDFQDRLRILDVDENGQAVAGQILAHDLEYSALKNTWEETARILLIYGVAFLAPALITFMPIFAIFVYLAFISLIFGLNPFKQGMLFFLIVYVAVPIFFMGALNFQSVNLTGYVIGNEDLLKPQENANEILAFIVSFLFVILCWGFALAETIMSKSPLRSRAEMLEQAVKQTGTELLIDKAGTGYFKNLEKAKKSQLQNVKNDNSAFIELGKSTSIFAQRRDPFAPTEQNISVGLSINDLSTHLFTLGASGTGKTTGVIRPVAHKWLELNQGGMFALDGKFSLPLELADLTDDFYLISPTKEKFNPIANMTPDSVANIISEICSEDGGDSDPFWSNSASLMLRMASIVVKYSSLDYTLKNIYKFCADTEEKRDPILKEIIELSISNNYIFSALNYFCNELPTIPEKTAGTISNMVRTWLGQITSHEILGEWVDTNSSVDVENVFTGAKIGLLLPQSEYGQGGLIISALVMRRVYDQAKKRGDQWKNDDSQKPVLLIADEVQNLLTTADLDNVAIARSLGLYLTMATQNIDGLYKRLGQEGAKQMLGNFASMVVLPPRTHDSNVYISERVGKIFKSVVERFEGLPDTKADISLFLGSGTDKAVRSIDLYNQAIIGHPRLSYLVGQQDEHLDDKGNIKYEYLQNSSASPTINLKLVELVETDEIDSLLAVPQSAIAIINRGRVLRRDVINLGFITGDQKS